MLLSLSVISEKKMWYVGDFKTIFFVLTLIMLLSQMLTANAHTRII